MLRLSSVGWVACKGNDVWKGGGFSKVNKFLNLHRFLTAYNCII